MPLFQQILVKGMVLIDAVLEIFVMAPSVAANSNPYLCSPQSINAGSGLTACGVGLIQQLGGLIVSGVGVLNGTLAAFSAITPVSSAVSGYQTP